MATKSYLVCDGCGKQVVKDEMMNERWFRVETMLSRSAYEEVYRQVMDRVLPTANLDNLQDAYTAISGLDLHKYVDYGEFCSLGCLANWASATAGMRSLESDSGDVDPLD